MSGLVDEVIEERARDTHELRKREAIEHLLTALRVAGISPFMADGAEILTRATQDVEAALERRLPETKEAIARELLHRLEAGR